MYWTFLSWVTHIDVITSPHVLWVTAPQGEKDNTKKVSPSRIMLSYSSSQLHVNTSTAAMDSLIRDGHTHWYNQVLYVWCTQIGELPQTMLQNRFPQSFDDMSLFVGINWRNQFRYPSIWHSFGLHMNERHKKSGKSSYVYCLMYTVLALLTTFHSKLVTITRYFKQTTWLHYVRPIILPLNYKRPLEKEQTWWWLLCSIGDSHDLLV